MESKYTINHIVKYLEGNHNKTSVQNALLHILDSIEAVVCVKDMEGRHLYANKYYFNTVGVDEIDVLGKTDFDIFSSSLETAEAIVKVDEYVKLTKEKKIFQEVVPIKNGELRHFKTAKAPLIIADDMKGVVCLAVDITDRIIAENRLKEITLAKASILAKLSHEIRTPLNSIIGFSNLILDNDIEYTNLNFFTKELLNYINSSSNHLLNVVNDVLDISKIDANKVYIEDVDFDMRTLVEEVSAITTYLAKEKSISFSSVLKVEDHFHRLGDKTKLCQVLVNLVNNALKFTSPGGKVLLRIKSVPNSNTVKFGVLDSGIGISKNNLKKIFSDFSQVNESINKEYEGAGLGLSISSSFVEALGGKLNVRSKYSSGSYFFFSIQLPFVKSQSNFGPSNNTPFDLARLSNKTCLLVEDYPLNQKVVSMYLSQVNMTVDFANNGLEALNKLRSKIYDIVLMDLQMPIMDGIEATKIRRKENCDDVIIALTANVTKEHITQCNEVGFNDFISKPFDKKNLFSKLLKWIDIKCQ